MMHVRYQAKEMVLGHVQEFLDSHEVFLSKENNMIRSVY